MKATTIEEDLLESAWGLIANAHGGNWDEASESSGWKKAATRWRDSYFKKLKRDARKRPVSKGGDVKK